MVDSDLEVPNELSSVHIIVRDSDERMIAGHEIPLVKRGAVRTQTEFSLPISFAVLPASTDLNQRSVVGSDD